MELLRKFYMADGAGGGDPMGPSGDDIRNAKELNEAFLEIQDTLTSVGQQLKTSITGGMEGLRGVAKRTAQETLRGLTAELKRASTAVDKTRQLANGTKDTFTSSKKIQESINTIKSRQASIENSILLLEKQGVEITAQIEEQTQAAADALQRQLAIEEKLLEKAKQREKAAGNIGKLFAGISKIPVLGQLVDSKEVLDKINTAAEKTGSKWAALGAGLSETFKSLGRSLSDPTTILLGIFGIIKGIVKSVIEFNQKTYEIAKNVGITVSEAEKLQAQFQNIAINSGNIATTSKDVAKTYADISNSLGFLGPANREFLETATLLQKRLGLSGEELKGIATQSALSGKSFKEVLSTLEVTRNVEGARNRLLLSQRQLIDAIAKTSSTVLLNFKGNVAELDAAIVRAVKLGTTLDTINKQGESLLDFESSIQKEFELQVLTGRDINLTRARELSLMGDTRGLMEELSRQQVTYDSFIKENVIQRQAEAAAVGLSVEELTKQLLQQKQANALGAEQGQSLQERYNILMKTAEGQEIIKKQLTEQEQADLRRASIQEKFQSAIERLKDTIGALLEGPVGGLIDSFARFVNDAEAMKMIAEALKATFGSLASALQRLPSLIGAAKYALEALVGLSIANAVASIVSSFSKIPGVGGAIGIAAGVGAAAWLNSLVTGGAGAPPAIGIPSTTAPEGMTAPLNPLTAGSSAGTATTGGGGSASNEPKIITVYTQIDGEVVAKKVVQHTPNVYGKRSN